MRRPLLERHAGLRYISLARYNRGMAMASWRCLGRATVRLAGVAALLFLAACTSPTPYQPAVDGFGYAEQQIEDNRYRVVFAGNSATPRTTVQNYLLFRAAEVTLESGHDYFKLAGENVERSTRYFGTVDPMYPRAYWHRRWRDDDPFFYPFGFSTVSAHPIDSYTAFADILVFSGEKPEEDPAAYDARDVIRKLRPTIVREPA